MSTALSLHRILLATPLSPAARERLGTFFVVDDFAPGEATSGECWAGALAGKSGVLLDGRCRLDAALLARLPQLQAVASKETEADALAHLDIQALSRAGVRATHTPRIAQLEAVERAWAEVEAALRRLAADTATRQDQAPQRVRWGRSVRLGPAVAGTLARHGEGVLRDALAARARQAGMRVVDAGSDGPGDAVLRVLAGPSGATDRTARGSGANVLDLGAQATLLEEPAARASVSADRDHIAAEGLVAALGFGRHGWHPLYWLNPEIGCSSCC